MSSYFASLARRSSTGVNVPFSSRPPAIYYGQRDGAAIELHRSLESNPEKIVNPDTPVKRAPVNEGA